MTFSRSRRCSSHKMQCTSGSLHIAERGTLAGTTLAQRVGRRTGFVACAPEPLRGVRRPPWRRAIIRIDGEIEMADAEGTRGG